MIFVVNLDSNFIRAEVKSSKYIKFVCKYHLNHSMIKTSWFALTLKFQLNAIKTNSINFLSPATKSHFPFTKLFIRILFKLPFPSPKLSPLQLFLQTQIKLFPLITWKNHVQTSHPNFCRWIFLFILPTTQFGLDYNLFSFSLHRRRITKWPFYDFSICCECSFLPLAGNHFYCTHLRW